LQFVRRQVRASRSHAAPEPDRASAPLVDDPVWLCVCLKARVS